MTHFFNKNYLNAYKMPKRSHKFVKKIFIFLLCIGFVLGTYFISNFLSKPLAVSQSFNLISKKSISKSYYAICFGKYNNSSDANICANKICGFGGAGYVVEKNSEYFVLGALYLKKEDAQKVIEENSIASNGVASETFQLDIFQIDLKLNKKYFSAFGSAASDIYSIIKDITLIVSNLYSLNIEFDSQKINNIAFASKVNDLDGRCCLLIDKLNGFNLGDSTESLKLCLNKIEKLLNNLTSSILQKNFVSALSKSVLIESVDLLSKINN